MTRTRILVQVVLKRPLQDAQQQLPVSEVAVSLPSIKTSLSDMEYALITSVVGANFSEPLHLADEARCAAAVAATHRACCERNSLPSALWFAASASLLDNLCNGCVCFSILIDTF